MTMGSELREVTLDPERTRLGEEVSATVRYRVRDSEPVLSLEVSSGYTVSPDEVPIPRTRTEARISFVVEQDPAQSRGYRGSSEDPDLCVVTFRLGYGAVMDANLWIER